MLLGCIADDFTGATDLTNTLSRHGMRTVQIIGEPAGLPPDTDAIVIALKSRTIPAREAVAQSLAACRWLKQHGARQNLFQVLLDLRLDRYGQYRPGGGCASG